jgi:hypothetical protein
METRREMKKKAIIQKNNINQAFEKMKAKGKMDPRMMEKLGITSATSARAASVASIDRGSQKMGAPNALKRDASAKASDPKRGRKRNENQSV